jgi:hypothetical protein
MIVKDNERTKEAGHWYAKDGKPFYTIVGKNGKERNTTLRDARSLNLVPSVSGIIRMAASPGLENWKLQQMLLASLTLPKVDGETEEQYIDRIIADSKETGKMAAERGTAIHASVQGYFEGIVEVQHQAHAKAVEKALNDFFGERPWECEKSFASPLGFGGKCDLLDDSNNGIVVDIKTKEFTDPSKIIAYDEHLMQLSAYRYGFLIPRARCANVFVSVQEPVQIKIVEWKQEDLDRGWAMFSSLLRFWQLKNNYQP